MSASIEDAAGQAAQAIGAFRNAAEVHAERVERLAALQRERPRQKLDALTRLVAETHPASGKFYSLTQADDLLQIDPAYYAYKTSVAHAEAAAREAEDEKLAAKLEAELQIVLAQAVVVLA